MMGHERSFVELLAGLLVLLLARTLPPHPHSWSDTGAAYKSCIHLVPHTRAVYTWCRIQELYTPGAAYRRLPMHLHPEEEAALEAQVLQQEDPVLGPPRVHTGEGGRLRH
jgi:hypothetical protein